MTRVLATVATGAVLVLAAGPALAAEPPFTRLDFLGEARLPTGMVFEGGEVGGLSSLAYDADRGVFYALSDDGSVRAPARFYTLLIDVEDGVLTEDDVRVEAVTTLRDEHGKPFPERSIDPEGLTLSPRGTFYLSSEGGDGLPFVREVRRDGWSRSDLPLPSRFLPAAGRGVRHNKAFEALTVTPDGATVVTASEAALAQDGPEVTLDAPSPARILTFDSASGRAAAEYLYWVDPLQALPAAPDGVKVSGLVELLALDGERFLALERAYVEGVGNRLRLFLASLAGAEDVSGRDSLAGAAHRVRAAEKTLLLDFAELGLTLDNVEGMTWGPPLAGGRRTLLFISDNNFDATEITQVFAFAASDGPVTIPAIQGASHRSPRDRSWVWGVRGVVTAVDSGAGGIWLQDEVGDGDAATSDGVFVACGSCRPPTPLRSSPQAGAVLAGSPVAATRSGRAVTEGTSDLPKIGSAVAVSGRVEEVGRDRDLTATQIRLRSWEAAGTELAMPPAVVLGSGGRKVPDRVIDDDGLARFEPESDAIDFFESLEGMRVEVHEPVVVGPSDSHGTFVVVADGGAGAGPRTARGGLRLTEADANPERILVDSSLVGSPLSVSVGDRFSGPIAGVVDYRFGGYRLVATGLPRVVAGGLGPETTSLRSARRKLTVATVNLQNFSLVSPAGKRDRLARLIAKNLALPDLVALQEVQDDSGPADDGMVTARGGLGALVAAIEAAGGPRYDFRQVDSVNNREGGQPGDNIRVAYLFDPARVKFVDRGVGGAKDSTAVEPGAGRGPRLTLSPGRVAATDPCFAGDAASGYEASRPPLAAEVVFAGKTLFLVNNHWISKGRDDRLFGARQPPQRQSETQRLCQARRVRDLVGELLALDPEARILVLGDLNEHEGRPPLEVLEETGLSDLVRRLPEADRYTYVFEGSSQVLDHVLVSPALARKGSPEIDIVHANAELADADRASDHDPVVVRLKMP